MRNPEALALLALAAFCAGAGEAPQGTDDALVGLWSYETRFDRALAGPLTVVQRGDRWFATIGGHSTEFRATDDRILFGFPDDGGHYRGTMGADGIRGFWIRPAVTRDPRYPGGSSQAFATPADLPATSNGTWQGTVHPLPDSFTLYLRIFRGSDGVLMAAFRNPEQHSHGPAMQYRVVQAGGTIRFSAGSDPDKPDFELDARRLDSPERLRIHWDDVAGDIELARSTPGEAANFFPRPPGSPPYAYRRPLPAEDGWETARAGDVGIDEGAVTRMIRGMIEADPAQRRASLIHSMLIARKGKLVVDEYFFGFGAEQTHDLRSAGKTFSSVLLGAAIKDGVRVSPATKVYDLMATRGPFANPDPRKAEITLAQLMTHSAGLACDDNDDASPGNENTMQGQLRQPDWWRYTLDLPLEHEPGTRYAYCSANINLVGGALTTATGTWLPELFDEKVARPLQFGEWHWNLMPTDEGYLGGGAFLRPRDLLKIGQVYLDGGSWKDQRIFDAGWVTESTAPRMQVTPATTGLSAEEFGNSYFGGSDALAWHLNPIHSGDRTYDAYAATGNGGQLLVVIPEFDMAVVFTGGNYLQGGIWGRWADQFIGGQIIPAIRKGETG